MREIKTHLIVEDRDANMVFADDNKIGAGGAPCQYELWWAGPNYAVTIPFQNGSIVENGSTGTTNEAVLAVLIDRLEAFQAGDFPCEENAKAIEHLRAALACMHARTMERWKRGVKGEAAV
jgi:hypothetical protein